MILLNKLLTIFAIATSLIYVFNMQIFLKEKGTYSKYKPRLDNLIFVKSIYYWCCNLIKRGGFLFSKFITTMQYQLKNLNTANNVVNYLSVAQLLINKSTNND